jgi:hypothetical protein
MGKTTDACRCNHPMAGNRQREEVIAASLPDRSGCTTERPRKISV